MKDKTQNKNVDNETKRVEFKKLVEICGSFKEDIDFQEMQDVDYLKTDSKEYEAKFKLKTTEDKVQQLLFDEYKKNRHSQLFDQMQDMILKSRNGNLIGSLLLMKIKLHDFEDMNHIILSSVKTRAGREMIEEVGKNNPRILKMTEMAVAESQNYRLINAACYIDGINVNKMAHVVMKLNDFDHLQDFGEQHAEDLSMRTRKMLSQQYKTMESGVNMESEDVRIREKQRK